MNDKNYDSEIQRLNSEIVEFRRRFDVMDTNLRKHDEDIRALMVSNKGIEVMQTQIMARLDTFETKVFNQMSQMQQQSQEQNQAMQNLFNKIIEQQQEDRQDEREHSKTWLQQFVDNNKAVIGLTVGALITGVVAYVTTKFGK